MIEIERAIKVLEEEYAFTLECDATQKRSSAYKTALAVLRAELARQYTKPLTCDGCDFDRRNEPMMEFSRRENCTRKERAWMTDRYDPKGEKA